ncbi:MAG: LysE family translocator [Pseudomonadota bacterium]
MTDIAALILVGGSILAGTIIPGSSFIVVSRAALTSRRDGVHTAFGVAVAVASVAFACLALGGFLVVLAQVPSLYLALKVAGCLYLCYLGLRIWRRASEATDVPCAASAKARTATQAFGLGVMTQGSNPKAAFVYASTFVAFLPPQTEALTGVLVILIVFSVSAGWYGAVALTTSVEPIALRYARSKAQIDRLAGAVVGTIGLSIILQSLASRT